MGGHHDSVTAPDALDELRATLGSGAVLAVADDLSRYEHPARGAIGRARAVVRPANVSDVQAVVRWARRHRVRLVAQGANTGLVGASVPDASGTMVVLSLERLRGDIVIDPVDRTAVVPAGTPLSVLNEALAAHGLMFPIDLGADPSIGGMVATNTGGSRMVRYGDVRHHVLGVEAVLADEDASVLDALSPLRKDNTGLRLADLFVGSNGALGVVTRVAIEVVPRPRRRATWWVVPRDDDAVAELLVHLEHWRTGALSAFELVSRPAFLAGLAHGDHGHDPFTGDDPPIVLLVEFSGDDDSDDDLLAALAAAGALMSDGRAVPADVAWGLRHAISDGLRATGAVMGFDVSTTRSHIMALRAAVAAVVARHPPARLCDFGHAGDGGLHLNIVHPAEAPPDADRERALRDAVYAAVAECHGSFSAEHGIGPANAAWWRRYTSPVEQRLTAHLKHLFDPEGILGRPDLPFSSNATESEDAT
jgi:FAD/FMN-containing dehydrogenase